ncbi:putative capsid protein [Circular genetic element sp.]|nr:putative capsid protein [Circular genetic element sp.]
MSTSTSYPPFRNYSLKRPYTAMGYYPINNRFKRRITTGIGRTSTRYRSNNSRSRYGPYRRLTSTDRHQSSVYPRPELKFLDSNALGDPYTGSSPQPITTAGNVYCLVEIPAGTGPNQRVGQQASIHSCAYRYEIDLPATPANQVPTSGRVIMFWDKTPQSNYPTVPQVLTNANYLAFMNLINRDRFVILRNHQFSLSPNGDQNLFFEGYVKINMNTTWSDQANTVPQSGGLFILFIGDQGTAANQPTINGDWRVRFYDC